MFALSTKMHEQLDAQLAACPLMRISFRVQNTTLKPVTEFSLYHSYCTIDFVFHVNCLSERL